MKCNTLKSMTAKKKKKKLSLCYCLNPGEVTVINVWGSEEHRLTYSLDGKELVPVVFLTWWPYTSYPQTMSPDLLCRNLNGYNKDYTGGSYFTSQFWTCDSNITWILAHVETHVETFISLTILRNATVTSSLILCITVYPSTLRNQSTYQPT